MAKFITRTYTDPKTGKQYQKEFRVGDNYRLRENGGHDDELKQDYTEAFQDQPSLGKTMVRGAAPSVLGGILGAASGRMNAGQAATAFGGQGLASAANAYANYQNRVNPNSKAAAVKSGALSTAANMFNEANQRNMARGAGTGASLLSGLGAGIEGLGKGALSAMPGGASLGAAVPSLLKGVMGAITTGDPSKLLGGLQGAATSVLSSKTFGQDFSQLFRRSEAKDYMGGTWGQGSGVDDLSDEEQAASNKEYLEANYPTVSSDMPADFEGTTAQWTSDDNADVRQQAQEQTQMDAQQAGYDAAIEKGGSEAEAQQAGSDAQSYFNTPLTLEDIDEQTDNKFVTPDNEGTSGGGNDTQQNQNDTQTQQPPQQAKGTGEESQDQGATDVGGAAGGTNLGVPAPVPSPQPQTQSQAQPQVQPQAQPQVPPPPPQQPAEVQAAQRLPNARGSRRVPPPPPPPAPPMPAQKGAGAPSPYETEASWHKTGAGKWAKGSPEEAVVAGEVGATSPEEAIQQRRTPKSRRASVAPVPAEEAAPAAEEAAPAAEEAAPAFAGLGRNEQDEHTWGTGKVPSFNPIEPAPEPEEPAALDYSKATKADIDADNERLMARQEEILKAQAPQGSTNYYNENPEKFEFLDGQGYRQEEAAKLEPQIAFTVQGDENYEEPSEEDSITDKDGRIFIRTPLGLLQVGDKSGKELPKAYRTAAQRLQATLSANEGEPSEELIKDAEELYNQLPLEVKGYTQRPSKERKAETLKNARMALTGKTSQKALKEEMTRLTDNARKWKISGTELGKLRDLYKVRKQQLRRSSPTFKQRIGDAFGGSDLFTDDDQDRADKEALQKEGRRASKEERIFAARDAAEKGGADLSKFSNRQKLEYLRQQEHLDRMRERPYEDRLQHNLQELEEEAKRMPEMEAGSPAAQQRDTEMRRLRYLISRTKRS